jgi:ribonuclease HI
MHNDKSNPLAHHLLATDGGCTPNPGTGSWGCIMQLRNGPEIIEDRVYSGRQYDTTNNGMELTALLQGLSKLPNRALPVLIVTDSKYLRDGFTKYLPQWKARGWRKADGKPVLNVALWQALDAAAQGLVLEWMWVPGHSGHELNERAHAAAQAALRDPKLMTAPSAAFLAHGFKPETADAA